MREKIVEGYTHLQGNRAARPSTALVKRRSSFVDPAAIENRRTVGGTPGLGSLPSNRPGRPPLALGIGFVPSNRAARPASPLVLASFRQIAPPVRPRPWDWVRSVKSRRPSGLAPGIGFVPSN